MSNLNCLSGEMTGIEVNLVDINNPDSNIANSENEKVLLDESDSKDASFRIQVLDAPVTTSAFRRFFQENNTQFKLYIIDLRLICGCDVKLFLQPPTLCSIFIFR